MRACNRFEEEGIRSFEKGLPMDEHFESCPDCRAARASYDRLREQIAASGEQYTPPPFWQTRVLAAVEQAPKPKLGRTWLRWAAPVGAAALATVLAVVLLVPPETLDTAISVDVRNGSGAPRRGNDAHPGDTLVINAATGSTSFAELRVYLNDRVLVLRCSTEPPCIRGRDRLEATLVLRSIGSYQPMLLTSKEPLPEPSSVLDSDAAEALAAHAEIELGREIQVR